MNRKKSYLYILLLSISLFMITGCAKENYWSSKNLSLSIYKNEETSKNVTLEILDKIGTQTDVINLELKNHTSDTYNGEMPTGKNLEICLDGNWYQAPLSNEFEETAVSLVIAPLHSAKINIEISDLKAPLIKGHYRMIHKIYNNDRADCVMCEFDVI